MKKILLLTTLIFSVATSSAQILKTSQDSLAYSVGVVLARSVNDVDSTLDKEMVVRGFTAQLSDKSTMTYEDAYQYAMSKLYPDSDYSDDSSDDQTNDSDEWSESGLQMLQQNELDNLSMLDVSVDGIKSNESGLRYVIESKGGKKVAKPGEEISFFFDLYDTDGLLIQSDRAQGITEPMVIANEDGEIIDGLLEGLRMLGKGGKARFYVPSYLAYGSEQVGALTPFSTLVFDVEIVKIAKAKKKK